MHYYIQSNIFLPVYRPETRWARLWRRLRRQKRARFIFLEPGNKMVCNPENIKYLRQYLSQQGCTFTQLPPVLGDAK